MRALFCCAVLALSGCTFLPAAQIEDGLSPVRFGGRTFFEADLGRAGDIVLHADVYLPTGPLDPDAPVRFPTILLLSPYWGEGTRGAGPMTPAYNILMERLLPRGYAFVLGDLAGQGGSSGCWDMMGPQERASAFAMVERIAAQPWSDGKVGMFGISYDAIAQVLAASDAPPHLVTVVPVAPLTHAYGGVMQNGVRYAGMWRASQAGYAQMSLEPPGTNEARYAGWEARLRSSPPCVAEGLVGDAPTDAYTTWYQERDLRAMGGAVQASVFYIQGFDDANVKPDNFGAWFAGVSTLKKAWLGHWAHTFPDARAAGRDDLYLTLHRWFDHELLGMDNGIDTAARIDVQDQRGAWRHETAWPPADAAILSIPLSFPTAVFGSLVSPSASSTPRVVEEAMQFVGAATVDLALASDRPLGQVVARLYDGDTLVSQGAMDLLYAQGMDAPRALTPGEAVRVSFDLYPTDHAWEAGASLRLVLSTSDAQQWYEGDASGAILQIISGSVRSPVVTRAPGDVFLVSCGLPMRPPVPACWRDLQDLGT